MNKYVIKSDENDFHFESEADKDIVMKCLGLLKTQPNYDYTQLVDMLNVLGLRSNEIVLITIDD
jgi:hypothetical protein